MKKTMRIGLIFLLLALTTFSLPAENASLSWGGSGDKTSFFDDASAAIEKRVSQGRLPALDRLYKDLFYAPLWVTSKGLSPFGKALLRMIETDETVTPSVALYHEDLAVRKAIENLMDRNGGSFRDKTALELQLSKLYLHYARYRIYGGIDWAPFKAKLKNLSEKFKIKVGWETYAPPASPLSVLNDALSDGDLARAFEAAEPHRFAYARLKQYLIRYIRIARQGGWPTLPGFRLLKPGQSNAKVVPLIRKHLKMVGDLNGCTEAMDSPKYDPCLVKAVKRFQLRHGLKGSGVIGRKTRAALNMTVTEAIQKIRLNLDRIKWLNHKEARMRIELNIPSFRLNFLDGDKLVTTIRVITGKPDHPTPVFHNVMKYIVVNPWWKIPEGIVKSEMLPKLIKDPYHYERQGKILKASWDETSERIDPGTVDWAQYRAKDKHIPYYFMQVPSRHNALGKIKFLFPNGYSVYIHDTPSKSLFFRNVRAFSHGCMRIQKPRELLESLALFNDNIHVDEVMKQLEGTEKKTLVLKHRVPVDITYLTAFVDPYGNLNFRRDVYHYDKYQMKNYAVKCVPLKGYKAKTADKSHAQSSKAPITPPAKKPRRSPTPKATQSPRPAPTPKSGKPAGSTAPKKHSAAAAGKRPDSSGPIVRKVDKDGYKIVEVYDN